MTKRKEKRAKILNFGMLYGMNEYTLADRFNISVEEAKDIKDRFWQAIPRIKAWQQYQIKEGKKNGTVYNYFGRPRRVGYYLNSSDYKRRAFGERTVSNTMIQSIGGDILRMKLIQFYKQFYSTPNAKYVRFLCTIHDEVNFSVFLKC